METRLQEPHGIAWYTDILTRTSSCSTEGDFIACNSTTTPVKDSTHRTQSHCTYSKASSSGCSNGGIHHSSSCSSLSSNVSSKSSTPRVSFQASLWQCAMSLGSLWPAHAASRNAAGTVPSSGTKGGHATAEEAEAATAREEQQQHACRQLAGARIQQQVRWYEQQAMQQAMQASYTRQQQQLQPGSMLQTASADMANPAEVSTAGFSQPYLQHPSTQLCMPHQQEQLFQQAYQQIQPSAAQQLPLQQMQFVPLMLPPQAYPAAAPPGYSEPDATLPQSAGWLQPGASTSPVGAGYPSAQQAQQSGLGRDCSRHRSGCSSSLWDMTWAAAGTLVQHVAVQQYKTQQQHELQHWHQRQQQQQQQQQPCDAAEPKQATRLLYISNRWGSAGSTVQYVASVLLYTLVSVVMGVLMVNRTCQAVAARVLGAKNTCTGYVQQQVQLFTAAMSQAADAKGMEQLKHLLDGASISFSSSSLGGAAASEGDQLDEVTAEAPPGRFAVGMAAAQCQLIGLPGPPATAITAASPLLLSEALNGISSLMVALGLWAGVLLWFSKWLLLQAPAATGNAVASKCQQGMSAAEEAGIFAVEFVIRITYGVALVLANNVRAVTVRAVQVGYVHGTAAAQQVCCVVLWVIGFLGGDNQQRRTAMQQLLLQALQVGGAATGWCAQIGMAAFETVAAAVTAKLLRDASPVTQTAVWGLAGMLRRNLMESCHLIWQLLLQLSQVYMTQLQQQQQGMLEQPQHALEGKAARKLH